MPDRGLRIEQIAHHLVHLPQAPELAQQQAHLGLIGFYRPGQIAYPGRIERAFFKQRLQLAPQLGVGIAQAYLVPGQMQPGPATDQPAAGEQLIHQADECRTFQCQGNEATQTIAIRAELIRLLLMETRQPLQHCGLQCKPMLIGEQQRSLPGSDYLDIGG
ncbi:hypothetical protein D3C76_977590 [compost metagenome]